MTTALDRALPAPAFTRSPLSFPLSPERRLRPDPLARNDGQWHAVEVGPGAWIDLRFARWRSGLPVFEARGQSATRLVLTGFTSFSAAASDAAERARGGALHTRPTRTRPDEAAPVAAGAATWGRTLGYIGLPGAGGGLLKWGRTRDGALAVATDLPGQVHRVPAAVQALALRAAGGGRAGGAWDPGQAPALQVEKYLAVIKQWARQQHAAGVITGPLIAQAQPRHPLVQVGQGLLQRARDLRDQVLGLGREVRPALKATARNLNDVRQAMVGQQSWQQAERKMRQRNAQFQQAIAVRQALDSQAPHTRSLAQRAGGRMVDLAGEAIGVVVSSRAGARAATPVRPAVQATAPRAPVLLKPLAAHPARVRFNASVNQVLAERGMASFSTQRASALRQIEQAVRRLPSGAFETLGPLQRRQLVLRAMDGTALTPRPVATPPHPPPSPPLPTSASASTLRSASSLPTAPASSVRRAPNVSDAPTTAFAEPRPALALRLADPPQSTVYPSIDPHSLAGQAEAQRLGVSTQFSHLLDRRLNPEPGHRYISPGDLPFIPSPSPAERAHQRGIDAKAYQVLLGFAQGRNMVRLGQELHYTPTHIRKFKLDLQARLAVQGETELVRRALALDLLPAELRPVAEATLRLARFTPGERRVLAQLAQGTLPAPLRNDANAPFLHTLRRHFQVEKKPLEYVLVQAYRDQLVERTPAVERALRKVQAITQTGMTSFDYDQMERFAATTSAKQLVDVYEKRQGDWADPAWRNTPKKLSRFAVHIGALLGIDAQGSSANRIGLALAWMQQQGHLVPRQAGPTWWQVLAPRL